MIRNYFYTAFLALAFVCVAVTSVQAKNNSPYFKDVVFQEGNDFLGLSFGISLDSAKMLLPEDALSEEQYEFLSYLWQLDENEYYLDLYFENDRLDAIEGFVYCHDKKGVDDDDAAELLYKDFVEMFEASYGYEHEEEYDDLRYTYWSDESVEVGIEDEEVYWYLANMDYYEEDYSDDYESTPLTLEEVMLTKDKIFDITLGDTRVKVKSKFTEEQFYDSDLNTLNYYIENGSNNYSFDFIFDEEDKVELIEGEFEFGYYYNEDESAQKNFYNELREMLNTELGTRESKQLYDERYISTYRFEGKEIILLMTYYSVNIILSYDK